MNRKNGFTFVELLGVIILIGLVIIIAVPAVNEAINGSKEKTLNKQMHSIFESAKNWGIKNVDLLPEENESTLVKIETLKEKGFLPNKEIINPVTEEELNECVKITYDSKFNQYDYEYDENCNKDNAY